MPNLEVFTQLAALIMRFKLFKRLTKVPTCIAFLHPMKRELRDIQVRIMAVNLLLEVKKVLQALIRVLSAMLARVEQLQSYSNSKVEGTISQLVKLALNSLSSSSSNITIRLCPSQILQTSNNSRHTWDLPMWHQCYRHHQPIKIVETHSFHLRIFKLRQPYFCGKNQMKTSYFGAPAHASDKIIKSSALILPNLMAFIWVHKAIATWWTTYRNKTKLLMCYYTATSLRHLCWRIQPIRETYF